MEVGSSLRFMTCDELRQEFAKCPDDINKRILIIDVRNPALYKRSHLCLDNRNNISAIRTKMRVMNIDPDLVKVCTTKNIIEEILEEDDLFIFKKRKDATEVIIIDSNTDNIAKLSDPRSKVMRIINGLTKFENFVDDKIVVPIHVLKGGYREWLIKYPHFTTDPTFNPDSMLPLQPKTIDTNNSPKSPALINPSISPAIIAPTKPPPQVSTKTISPQPRSIINKPVPAPPTNSLTATTVVTPNRPIPTASKPNIIKNAPGTAVPVTPILSIRSPLPRSHSSPNVAQADGDELINGAIDEESQESMTNRFYEQLRLQNDTSDGRITRVTTNINNNIVAKPRFDRTLKPAFNNEAINMIRAKLDFGRSPEASDKAKTGLHNLGNTCYMNSVVQCLAYAPSLVNYFCSDTYYNHINFNSQYGSRGELAIEFGALVEKLNAHRYRYIEPKSFQESIIKHLKFTRYEQQDSHEFMMKLFDKLHHDLNINAKDKSFDQNGTILHNNNNGNNDDSNINIPNATLGFQNFCKKHLEMNKSIISDLFEGIFMSTLTCTFCQGPSNTFEVFNCLSLPIPPDVGRCPLRDCLNHFSNPEKIAAWECPRCKRKREAVKKIVICRLPKILIIHLKRFSYDENGLRKKLQTTVDFPLIDLHVDCTNVLQQSAYKTSQSAYKTSTEYNLFGVVNHEGSLDGGHYKAFCRLEDHQWYTFNDSNVSDMRDTDVKRQEAYILFYGTGCQ